MLDKLAPHSRLWIYQSDRKLNENEIDKINHEMSGFIKEWASHGNELYGDFTIQEGYFLIIGADEQRSPTSGCSLDTLTRKVKELGEQNKIDFFNRLNIAYINDGGDIELIGMPEFKSRAQKDSITGQTIIFNNLIEKKSELDKKWKTTVNNSWHKNLLDIY